ncbi:MAG: family 16 glycosylhydrolase [Mycobacterium sp.]|nr:family 16 glycosylhydrolase [Mycobacterium sp.]
MRLTRGRIGGLAVLLTVVVVSPAAAAVSAGNGPGQPGGAGWTKVWTDTFNGGAGSGVDTSVWKYNVGTGVFGTGEIETMTNSTSNVHLDGHGDLEITALGHGQSWTSGRIQTISSGFGAPAGGEMAVTASIRQPNPAAGLGYWPAFWMLGPGDWPGTGEIDILEDVNALNEQSGTFHCGNLDQPNPDGTLGPCHEFTGLSSGLRTCPGCQTGFHTYTVIVDRTDPTAEQIRWYIDGRQFFRVNQDQVDQATWTAAVHHGYSIIFDLAMGGGFPNGVCQCSSPSDQTTSGGTMTVRYVSVYNRVPEQD